MTNEPVTTKKARKKGTLAIQLGGLATVVSAFFIAAAGTITAFTAILFLAGIVALVIGLVKRNADNN